MAGLDEALTTMHGGRRARHSFWREMLFHLLLLLRLLLNRFPALHQLLLIYGLHEDASAFLLLLIDSLRAGQGFNLRHRLDRLLR